MARRKVTANREVLKAEGRLDGSKAINPMLDLGNGLTITAFETVVGEHHDTINMQNTKSSELDELGNKNKRTAQAVKVFSERWLKAVGIKFGFDSDEYEMAGGTRKSERKKPQTKPVKPPPTP